MHYTKLNYSVTNPVIKYIFKREPLKITLYSKCFEGTKTFCEKNRPKCMQNVDRIIFLDLYFSMHQFMQFTKLNDSLKNQIYEYIPSLLKLYKNFVQKKMPNNKVIIHRKP